MIQLASLGKRMIAGLIDIAILIITYYIVLFFIGFFPTFIRMFLVLIIPFLILAYFIVLEYRYGQTVGKKIMRLVVLTQEGKRIILKHAIIRNVLRVLDALPFLYLIGLITIVLTKRKQRIGDIAAKTIVVEMK